MSSPVPVFNMKVVDLPFILSSKSFLLHMPRFWHISSIDFGKMFKFFSTKLSLKMSFKKGFRIFLNIIIRHWKFLYLQRYRKLCQQNDGWQIQRSAESLASVFFGSANIELRGQFTKIFWTKCAEVWHRILPVSSNNLKMPLNLFSKTSKMKSNQYPLK